MTGWRFLGATGIDGLLVTGGAGVARKCLLPMKSFKVFFLPGKGDILPTTTFFGSIRVELFHLVFFGLSWLLTIGFFITGIFDLKSFVFEGLQVCWLRQAETADES